MPVQKSLETYWMHHIIRLLLTANLIKLFEQPLTTQVYLCIPFGLFPLIHNEVIQDYILSFKTLFYYFIVFSFISYNIFHPSNPYPFHSAILILFHSFPFFYFHSSLSLSLSHPSFIFLLPSFIFSFSFIKHK